MSNVLCPICSGINVNYVRGYRSINSVFSGMKLVRCNGCSMYFACPMPSNEALADFNSSYFDSAHGGQSQEPFSVAFFTGLSKLRASYLTTYMKANGSTVKAVLEIGPGPGYFAENWIDNNPDSNYYAIETDRSCHGSLKERGVQVIDVNHYSDFATCFDLVVISHVLEHVSNPHSFIQFATKNLKKGGILFIDVPCSDWEHKPFDEPHLLFFTKEPMNLLLEKCDFHKIQLNYFGETIQRLKNKSAFVKKFRSVRSRLIRFVFFQRLFSSRKPGMEALHNGLERAVLAPFKAHEESKEPAWWLRAISIKK